MCLFFSLLKILSPCHHGLLARSRSLYISNTHPSKGFICLYHALFRLCPKAVRNTLMALLARSSSSYVSDRHPLRSLIGLYSLFLHLCPKYTVNKLYSSSGALDLFVNIQYPAFENALTQRHAGE